MKGLSRSTALKIAAVVSFLTNASSIVSSIGTVRMAAANPTAAGSLPYSFFVIGLIISVVGVVAAWGVWKQQRWGIVLTILANLISGLMAAPGILFAPTPGIKAIAVTGVAVCTLIIVLCLWRDYQSAAA
jgi:hypothetical protein